MGNVVPTAAVDGACSCGCSSAWLLTKALEPCGCGCRCCRKQPRCKTDEVAALRAVEAAIDERLGQLGALDPPRAPGQPLAPPGRRPRIQLWPAIVGMAAIVGLAALIPLLILLALAVTPPARGLHSPAPGSPGPDFALPRLGAAGQYGTAELQGNLVVVTFWSSWCEPCVEEARQLEEIWQRHRHDGLVVLGVNVSDTEADALAFLHRHGISYPNVRDWGMVTAGFGATGMPETHFFNENWELHAANRGFELWVDVRSGMLVRQPGVPSMLERSLQGLFATRFDEEPKPGLA